MHISKSCHLQIHVIVCSQWCICLSKNTKYDFKNANWWWQWAHLEILTHNKHYLRYETVVKKVNYVKKSKVDCDPGIMGPGIIVRPWLFLLMKEGCGCNSYSLEHPQAYTFTDLLWWHLQVSSEGPVTHSYVLIEGCLPGVTATISRSKGWAGDFWLVWELNLGPLAWKRVLYD